MNRIKEFYKSVLLNKAFYIPILLLAIVGYSNTIYNTSISYDDLMRDHYFGSGNVMLSGRWGMVLWLKILGLVDFVPFTDRFVALLFLICAAVLLCYLIDCICKPKKVLSYTVLACLFVSYPLICAIWEYAGANFVVTGDLVLVTMAAIVVTCMSQGLKRNIIATLLLILPVASYESSVFYYISLVCAIFLYEGVNSESSSYGFKRWIKKNINYFLPLFLAVVLRFLISFLVNWVYGLDYHSGGDTTINWIESGFFHALLTFGGYNVLWYIVAALVYFPIAIFLVISILYLVGIIVFSIKTKKRFLLALGVVFYISLFALSIIQGQGLGYRHAQTISLFVGFTAFMICELSANKKHLYIFFTAVLLFLSWHQAVYTNNILSLNEQRTDNEMAMMRYISTRLISEFERKPVVFVSPYENIGWVRKRIFADNNKWNGKLYLAIKDKIRKTDNPTVYSQLNIIGASWEYPQIKEMLSHCGFDIEVIAPRPLPHMKEYNTIHREWLKNAIEYANLNDMKSYQIVDNGDYIIVKLGNTYFEPEGYVKP